MGPNQLIPNFLFCGDPGAELAFAVAKSINEGGGKVYFFGHCVRNFLAGKPITKYSIVTDMSTNKVSTQVFLNQIGKKIFPEGADHIFRGPDIIFSANNQVDVIVYPLQKKRVFGENVLPFINSERTTLSTLERPKVTDSEMHLWEDANSRAYTIEAIYYDPFSNRLIDFFGAREALKKGSLNIVPSNPHDLDGSYEARIRLNPDSMIRGLAYISEYNLVPDSLMISIIKNNYGLLDKVQKSTLRKYLEKLLNSTGMEYMSGSKALALLIPIMPYLEQYYLESNISLMEHTCNILDEVNKFSDCSLELKWAATLHEVSRPIHGTEKIYEKSSNMAKIFLSDILGYPDVFVDRVAKIIYYLNTVKVWNILTASERLLAIDKLKEVFIDVCRLATVKGMLVKDRTIGTNVIAISHMHDQIRSKLINPPFFTGPKIKEYFWIDDTGDIDALVKECRTAQLRGTVNSFEEAVRFISKAKGTRAKTETEKFLISQYSGRFS